MSKTVDEKVVEMRFDNKQFEANVKTSMSTLDKLKSSLKLDDASKGLEKIDKASKNISFDTIATGVEALQKRFSTFGIIGMRVIENMTDSMMNLANRATNFMTDGIIQGGKKRAMNLENAHFQLQGLLKDEEAVDAVMKNVNDSVDGTAYSLDSAAKVASQLAASGMRAGDQMFSSLRAVAGVAAMTNSEYDEIGRIFTKVAGQGRLMGDDLLSLSSRGMNAAATLGAYLHKSEAEIRDMVSKGKLDFKTFAAAMDDAFGEHAKKANETFTGALSNIRAALARIGALFISPLVEQNGALVQLFNAIRQRINDIKSAIQPLADLFVKGVTTMANALTSFLTKLDIKTPIEKMMNGIIPKWDQFSSKLEATGISADDFQKKLTEVAGKHGVSVDSLIQKYGSLGKVMSAGKISKNIIIETLKSFVNTEKNASAAATEITTKLETFNKVTKEIINGNYGNGAARVKALTDAGYEYVTMQKLVNYVWKRNGKTWKNCNITADELTNAISGLSKEELKSIGYTEEQANKLRQLAEESEKTGTPLNELISKMTKPSGKELIIDSFRNALKGLSSVMAAVKNAWNEMIKPFSTNIFSTIAEKIHTFSQKLVLSEENADKLKRTFKGLFAILDLIRSVIGGTLTTAVRLINRVLSIFGLNILDVTAYIGDAIMSIRNWVKEHNYLSKALNIIIPKIKSVTESIGAWIKNNETIQNGIKKFVTFLNSAVSSIREWTNGLKETDNIPEYIISGFINGIKENIPNIVNVMIDLAKRMLNAVKNVLGIHSPSTAFFEIGKNVVEGFANGIKSGISGVLSLLGKLGDKCVEILSVLDFGKIFAAGISGGLLYTANHLLDTIEKFSALPLGIGKMTSSIGKFFDSLALSIKPNKLKNMSKTVMELAVAIGILSTSVYALAQLDTAKLWGAIGALAALSAILGVLSFAVNKMNVSGKGFSQLALMLVAISASLYVMAAAIKKLDFLTEDNIKPILGGVSTMIAGMVGILLALSVLTKTAGANNIGKSIMIISAISSAMLLMSLAIKNMSNLNPSEITKGIGNIMLFALLITGLMAATRLAGKNVANIASTILSISAAMILMTRVIKLVSGLKSEEITKGIICMTLFGGLITGLMAATRLIGGSNTGKMGSTILGISAAIMLMSITIKMVSNMKIKDITNGIICMTLFGGLVTALIAATRLAGGNNLKGISSTLLAMSLSVGVLAGIAVILSLIDIKSLAKGITAVGLLSAMVAAMMYAARGVQNCKTAIIAMTVTISLMAASIAALSFIDTGKLAAATVALSSVMGMFALMAKALSNFKMSAGSIIGLTALNLIVIELGVILGVMEHFNIQPSIETATSLSVLLLAMSGALAILSKIESVSASAIGAMALLGLVVAELGAILGVMAYFNIQPSIETATSLSVLLLAMSGALGILTLVGAGGPAAFIGVGALATLIAAIGGLMVGIGALVTYIPDMQTWLNTGMAVLEQIGYGLGSFFGNIVGGFLGGVSAGLPQIGTNISQFMLNMQPFFTAIGGLDENSTNAVKALAETILILTGAGIIDGITSWLTGGSSLSSFGKQLVPFGKAIKKYGDAVADINTNGIQQSVAAGKALAELANVLPNSGGVVGFFAGENDMDGFAEKLVPFGEAIKEYGDTVAGINTSGIQQSVEAGQALSDLANVLPNSGGAAGFFAGENDIDKFGEKLVPFGKAIKEYGDEVSGIDVSGIQQSVTAGHALAELADALPNSGGVAGFFAGNNDMDKFGENLVKFGSSLAEFSNTVSGINVSGVTSQLSGLTNVLIKLGSTAVDKFADSFKNGSSKVTSGINSMVKNCTSAITNKAGDFKTAGTKCVTRLVDAIKSKSSSVSSTVKNAISQAVSAVRGYYSSMYSAGSYVASGLAAGIRAGTPAAVSAARSMASQVEQAARTNLQINSPSKVFMDIGRGVGEGLEKGIADKNQISRVLNATVGLAGDVISSARNTFGINSPSRAFMAIGRYIGEGLAQGIRDSAYQAVYWTEDMGQKVISAASKAYEDVEKWVQDAKAFDELSLAEELEIWEAVIAKYAEGTEERTKAEKNAYSVYKELQKENYESSKNWIDQEKEYNRLSKQEELEAWQRIQSRYIEGTDERKEADKQVYKLRHELIDDSVEMLEQEISRQKELLSTLDETSVAYQNVIKEIEYLNSLIPNAQYQESMNWVYKKDFYGRDRGLAEELGEQLRILKKCVKGTEEYKKARQKIYTIEKEMHDARKDYEKEYEQIEEDAADKRVELEKEKADKIKEINDQLQSDIEATEEKYTSQLESRTKALYDSYGLFDEVKAKEEVSTKTLMDNLQNQVDEFKDWQSVLDSLSARGLNEGLVEELQDMGPSAIAEIKALSSMSDSQLQQYAILWSDKHKLAKNKATEELENLRIETNTAIKALRKQANNDLNDYLSDWNDRMDELNANTEKQLEKLTREYKEKVGIIRVDTESQMREMGKSVSEIMLQVGENIVNGLVNGINNQEGVLYDTINGMFSEIVSIAHEVPEIHSPSKVFFGIGEFIVKGLVNGINHLKDNAVDSCGDLGYSVINSMSSSISRIADIVDGDIDYQPTIAPVLDLTNVRSGLGMIDNAFAANRGLSIGSSVAMGNQNDKSELFGKLQEVAEKSNNKLTSAIDSLRNDFSEMASKLERMQVVLDSGALVGEIAPDMDSALGGLAKMNRRGVR